MPNAIKYIQFLFNQLLGDLVSDEERNKLRLKPNPDDHEKEFEHFERLKISGHGEILHDVKWFSFNLSLDPGGAEESRHRTFVGFTGCKFQKQDLENLEGAEIFEHDINAGIFLRLVNDVGLELKSEISPIHLEQDLASQHLDPLYEGHDFDEIKKYFEDVILFEVKKDSIVRELNEKLKVQYILSNNSSCVRLPFGDVGDGMRELFVEKSPLLFDNIFSALTSTYWEHAFLELYRSIEAIYQIPRMIKLKGKLGDDFDGVSTLDLAKLCYEELGWRPFEKESLKSLLTILPEDQLECQWPFILTHLWPIKLTHLS
ncbi:hypothetical protein [Marinobacter sp. Arc7-DN-1]|uniref:hypothetical protein n=1 Tax=Marinobacter sp. Arc7-DN-1 TaxID=2304594 RepID=UPI000E453124|nr:hypothetical protein [Marinobacter sp. Arc7-DN-1]AXS82311.1 hypothetical protein D0851_04235 [Marinobacter sp. Arc7-DN-1]